MKRIGFIGLGTMGLPMAKRILEAGYPVTVYNRTLEKAQGLKSQGAEVASSPVQVAEQCEIVFTMLTADLAVEEVILGEQGLIKGASGGMILVDCSTISPTTSKKIANQLITLGVDMLDAPVTGSEPAAIEGTLSFLVGGKKECFEQCRPLFTVLGQKASYLGENGAGASAKLAHNVMAAINLLSLTEGLVIAKKSGIDPELFAEAIGGGGGRSNMLDMKLAKILGRDFRAHFATQLMHKDLRLASELSSELKLPVPVLSIVREMLQMAISQGYGDEDMCSVIKIYEQWANTEVEKN